MANSDIPQDLQASIDATQVTYKQLGTSGLRVSVPILGAMSIGHKDWQNWVVHDEAEVFKLLQAAYDRGLNSWDTANIYSNGVSEELIGRFLKHAQIPRRKVVLLTKCFGYVGETPGLSTMQYPQARDTRDYVNQGGLSRAAIFNAVDASLERLQTSYIDVLQIHRFDPEVPVEETMEALHDLVRAGKVRYIGASSMWAYQFAKMQFAAERRGWTKFVSMQNHYSLCYREEEREMIPFCKESGVGLIPWSPLFRGLLARPLDTPETDRTKAMKDLPINVPVTDADNQIISRVEELAKKKGWAMSQVALAWILQKGAIPIVGLSSVKRLDEAVKVTGKELTDEEIKYLEEPYVPRAVSGHS
ncbi:aldo-keto reductase [Diplodia corticola]|uniref:Aldo-keto reductase n=1 Tax=Diplodia corticola TaxID=236234 RepID=A0A1J9SIM8_9PEZI|nr:aldo-keto reductase [Diplodia corticola]OJD40215.1 aldo-keto reductase [Diplodia corticola]